VPNFILAFIPAEINPNTLNTMTAFAVSVLPHKMTTGSPFATTRPHVDRRSSLRCILTSRTSLIHGRAHRRRGALRHGRRKEEYPDWASHHLVIARSCIYTDTKFLCSSLGIFVGFASFFIMEKTLRVLGGGEEGGHSHSHSHSASNGDASTGHASGVSSNNTDGLKSRKSQKDGEDAASEEVKLSGGGAQPSKLSAYLNLFGDFVHNM
jgi:solute carrier family 39 (zinc transporter), member 7